MNESTYDDLNTLLDSLTGGENIKVTWSGAEHLTTIEGPVYIGIGRHCSCRRVIRWADGTIDSTLTSIEVTRTEDVTVSHEAVDTLHALIDALFDLLPIGQEVTAEWRNESGSMTSTGKIQTSDTNQEVRDPLHYVTLPRTVVTRWKRGVDGLDVGAHTN